jgi:hypothetical protein
MAIVKVKMHMILSLFIFNIAFWLWIANPPEKKFGWRRAGGGRRKADHSDNEVQA